MCTPAERVLYFFFLSYVVFLQNKRERDTKYGEFKTYKGKVRHFVDLRGKKGKESKKTIDIT